MAKVQQMIHRRSKQLDGTLVPRYCKILGSPAENEGMTNTVLVILNDSCCNPYHLDLPNVGQCIKIKSFRWQQSESCQNVNMKNAYLYCHPMASVIYIEANFPAGNTRMLRTPTNQIEEAGTDIQLDGNNLSICMETFGKYKL